MLHLLGFFPSSHSTVLLLGIPRRSNRQGSPTREDRDREAQACGDVNKGSCVRGGAHVRFCCWHCVGSGTNTFVLVLSLGCHSIYLVHDDQKEKDFELEMSWIGDETGGKHLPVPKELHDEAEQKAKDALENFAE